MMTLSDVFFAIVVFGLLLFVVGAGVIEMLKRIEKAINQNYQASLARAMTTTDIAVKVEKESVRQPCICGHRKADHWKGTAETLAGAGAITEYGQGPCHSPAGCVCQEYKPKRGPWPGEVKG